MYTSRFFKYIFIGSLFFSTLIIAQSTTDSSTIAKGGKQHRHRHGRLQQKHSGLIYGKITDNSNEALPGANISLTNTNIGAASASNGVYTIANVPPGEYSIRVSMIGYEVVEKKVTVRVNSRIKLDFELDETVMEVDEIVITGTGTPELYSNATVKTSVVQRDLIERQKANNLAEAIDLQLGVRVESNCQNCNYTQVRLLGLEGHYSQILIDSDPIVSKMAAVYGLEQFPREMIDRVEIVKGGGSALYGSQAVAGVVNLMSRVSKSGTSGGYLFGTMRNRSPFDFNKDGFSEIGKLKNQAVGLNWRLTPDKGGELALNFHYIHEERRGGDRFDLPPHQANVAEWIESWRYGGAVNWSKRTSPLFNYKAFLSFAYANRNTYYGAHQDPNAYGKTNNPLLIGGLHTHYFFRGNLITAGIQAQEEFLRDEALGYGRSINDQYRDIGLILQDNIKFGSRNQSELIAGVRIDKHSKLDPIVTSPRIALKWNIKESLIFRGGLSTGFEAPQVFDEDLHITQVGGEGHIIRNSLDLKAEKSKTLYGGLEYREIVGVNALSLTVNGFYTRLQNKFILDKQDDPLTEEVEFYRLNGAGALVQGVETEVGLRMKKAEIVAGITVQESKWEQPDPDFGSLNIFRTPNIYGSARLSYDLTNKVNLLGVAKYTGRMYAPHYAGYIEKDRLEHTPAFFTLDIVISYRAPLVDHLFATLTAGIYNITNDYQRDFDIGANRDSGYVYGPLVSRRTLVGISFGR